MATCRDESVDLDPESLTISEVRVARETDVGPPPRSTVHLYVAGERFRVTERPLMPKAACLGSSVDFHPDREEMSQEEFKVANDTAIAVCLECSEIEVCRAWAIGRERLGVWGGMTARQRKSAVRKRNRDRLAAGPKTHCQRNHPYDAKNTYIDPLGYRHCRACKAFAEQKRVLRSVADAVRGA